VRIAVPGSERDTAGRRGLQGRIGVRSRGPASPAERRRWRATAAVASGSSRDGVGRFAAFAGLGGLCLVLWILTPHFLTVANILNVMEQTSINAIVAIGMTYVIISGGIDLSVGSILALSGVVLAKILKASASGAPNPAEALGWFPLSLALSAALAVGAAVGVANGVGIAFGRLPPFIMTLGMMSVARGAALLATDGRPVSGFDPGFRSLATGSLLAVPASIVMTIAFYLLAHLVLSRTRFGRYAYGIGGNEEATRLSGVPVRFHKTMVYGVSGLTSAVAAVLLTARLNTAQPIAGINYELDAIAATVIGGTSLSGGEGALGGTLVGALTMGVLRNGLNLLGVSSFLQQITIGAVIIAAVLVDRGLRERRR
jgi:ribose transport system permease protein